MVTRPSNIQFHFSPEELSDSVKIQLEARFIKLLRKLTIQNIKMKIIETEIRSNTTA